MTIATNTQVYGPKCHENGITGYGNPESGVIIVGIAPGRNEVIQCKPFVGASGQLLDQILEGVGWSREKVYCTNLICWYKDSPTPDELAACSHRLKAEIEKFEPHLVITLGKLASEYIGNDELKNLRGRAYWHTGGFYHLSTYHPAAILRGGTYFIHDLVRDLNKIQLVMSWPKGGVDKVPYVIVTDQAAQQSVLDNLPRDTFVALDIETTSKEIDEMDVFVDDLLCLSISDGIRTYVFPADNVHNLQWPTDIRWTFHNGMFDVQGLRRYLGFTLPIVHDTLLMSYNIDERKGIHSLKSLSREFCGAGFYEAETKKYRNGKLHQVAPEKVWYYNAHDAAYTARLAPTLYKIQSEDNVLPVYNNILLPAANAFVDIQYRGTYVDQEELKRLAKDWLPRYLKMEQKLIKYAQELGWQGEINLNSPQQVSKLLYQIVGLVGGPSVDKKHLDSLRKEHKFVDQLLSYRQLDHVINSYVLGIMDDIKRDGRVHAQVLLNGTTTGRLSYRKPPLQTIPQPYQIGAEYGQIRNIFAPADDEHVIVETDYEKIEVWGAYIVSGDPTLYADLCSSDFHRNVAATIFNVPYEQVTSLQRKNSKFVTFGMMYGRGPASLAVNELQCSFSEAKEFVDNWKARYHVYVDWTERMKREVQENGELVSPTGRKRRFKLFDRENLVDQLNKAVNAPIQCMASDCNLSAMIELHRRLAPLDSYILWLIHDAIVFEVSKKNIKEALHVIKDVQTSPRFPGLPGLPIEIKIGRNWGKTVEVKDIDTFDYSVVGI